jgi:hypothetical protein
MTRRSICGNGIRRCSPWRSQNQGGCPRGRTPAAMQPTERALTIVLATCALFSGIALVITVLLNVSLGVTLAALAVFVAIVVAIVWRLLPRSRRPIVRRQAVAGAVGGIVGVLCYDGVRFAIVAIFHLHVQPFEALPHFGALIAGVTLYSPASWLIGIVYHYANGVLFGGSYGIVLADAPWLWAIPWALGLELFMLMLYPGFLHLKASVLGEFTVVSLCGHLGYGLGLGLGTKVALRRTAARVP